MGIPTKILKEVALLTATTVKYSLKVTKEASKTTITILPSKSGAIAGAIAGAAAGKMIPGISTVTGTVVGGVIGLVIGLIFGAP